jgi:hypothetical protein
VSKPLFSPLSAEGRYHERNIIVLQLFYDDQREGALVSARTMLQINPRSDASRIGGGCGLRDRVPAWRCQIPRGKECHGI